MLALNQSEPYPDPMSIPGDLVHLPQKFMLLSYFSRPEMMVSSNHVLENDLSQKGVHVTDDWCVLICLSQARLKHYTKFLFVRDPFVRLISAYRNKFRNYNKYYYQNFGREILRLYGNQPDPPLTVDEAFASGVHPSFYNFIQYILDPRTEMKGPLEPHWRQMHRLCHPCLIE